jgi:hypothetical protein
VHVCHIDSMVTNLYICIYCIHTRYLLACLIQRISFHARSNGTLGAWELGSLGAWDGIGRLD